jgi:hypothetical protein
MIPIYKAEREAGLVEQIRTQGSISYASTLSSANPKETLKKLIVAKANEIAAKELAEATNQGQIDLHYLDTILATVGWNKNQDVFDKVETWIARYTPEDKPWNLEHDPRCVRGHITGNYVIDIDGNVIAQDTDIDDLPDKYHVVTSGVLYKFLLSKDTELTEEMAQVISEITEGKWFVSMEALFTNFDYAVVTPKGENIVLARNEESAFLTKHLKAYGGSGEYEGHQLGRLMRNITFSGKGLVRCPANPESIIFADVATFKPTNKDMLKEFTQIHNDVGYRLLSNASHEENKERDRMADTNVQVEVLQKELASKESSLTTLAKKNEELEKRLNELNEKQVSAKITDLDSQIKSQNEKITSLQAQVAAEQAARTEAEAKLTKTTEELAKASKELAEANLEKSKATRVSQWVERTGVDHSVATKVVASLIKLDDEEFKNYLETQPAKAATETTKASDDKAGANNADTKKLDEVQSDENTQAGAGSGVNTNVEATKANIASFLKKNYLRSSKNKSVATTKE